MHIYYNKFKKTNPFTYLTFVKNNNDRFNL